LSILTRGLGRATSWADGHPLCRLPIHPSQLAESLGEDQLADGLVIADLVANWLLETQAVTPLGSLSEQLGTGDFHLAVHNAAGMVSVQLGVGIAAACHLGRDSKFRRSLVSRRTDRYATRRLCNPSTGRDG